MLIKANVKGISSIVVTCSIISSQKPGARTRLLMVNEFVVSRTGLLDFFFFLIFASLLCTLLKTLNRGSKLSEFSYCRLITR